MSTDKGVLTERPYVMVGPDGVVHHLGLYYSEKDCWRVALGWPDEQEIEARKQQGFAVYPATVSWTKSPDTKPAGFVQLAQSMARSDCDQQERAG